MPRHKKITTVVNRHHDPYDEYVGRGSTVGNPFEVGVDGAKAEVIEKYRLHFNKKIRKQRFRNRVEAMRGKRLGCFCRPREGFQGRLLCHAQIIWGYLENKPPEECP